MQDITRTQQEMLRTNFDNFLKQYESRDLLRFLTCGSVDDGKSTLIGRLLYDSRAVYEDQLEKTTADSRIHGTTGGSFDPALLTDGLKAEREQGITIDVAYRYFSTGRRKFIIADCPGHEQYTRNMATGASNCNLTVILIDARQGVVTQTRRHSFICSLLGIRHVIVAVNKMDLVDWSEEVFERIVRDYNAFAARMSFPDIHFIPVCALTGENVVKRGEHMPWYNGSTLLRHLESVSISTDRNLIDTRLPIQYVLRPDSGFRGFSGTLASGILRSGDEVTVLPSRSRSRIRSILGPKGELCEAFAPQAITVTLENETDVSRGDLIAPVNNLPHAGSVFEAMVVWMHETAARPSRGYLVKLASCMVPCVLSSIRYKVDIRSMHREQHTDKTAVTCLELNEIGRCRITLHRPAAFDPYDRNRATGAFILIDRLDNATVGAGMIVDREIAKPSALPAQDNTGQQPQGRSGATVWLTGLSGSGKSTISQHLEHILTDNRCRCCVLDGDIVREGLCRDLEFSPADRSENIRRIAEVAALMNKAGLTVITALISPRQSDRAAARKIIGSGSFIEVFIDTPLQVCEQRDPKGLYRKARAGEVERFTGIGDPYEVPHDADLAISTEQMTPREAAALIASKLEACGAIDLSGQIEKSVEQPHGSRLADGENTIDEDTRRTQ